MSLLDRRAFLGNSIAAWSALHGAYAISAAPPLALDSIRPSPASDAPSTLTPDTLFLTWRTDPTTTMMIQWVGKPQTGDVIVEYARWAKNALWRTHVVSAAPYPGTDLLRFRSELTDLEPGTEYLFRIGTRTKVHRFRTMPSRATDTFQFVSGGDCGVNEHAVANNILAAKQDPMFVLIGGDLGYDNGRSAETSLGFLRNYSRHMLDTAGRLIPLVVCIGNHEVDGGYGQPREKAPFYFALHDGLYDQRSYATLDFGDYLSLVLLDSGHIATIDGEQTDWLDGALRERSERAHVIAVNHVPAYPSYRAADTTDGTGTGGLSRRHWVPLFEQHNVDVVLEHHDHTFKRTQPLKDGLIHANGIVYLGDGSWGKLRAPKAAEARPYLARTSGSYHMSLHRLEGERRFHVALEETGRVVDICTTTKRARHVMGRGG